MRAGAYDAATGQPASSSAQLGRLPPEAIFVAGGVSQYLGAAIAVGLFADLAPGTVAVLRVIGAAAIIVVVRRSWRRPWTRAELAWSAAFGITLATMNLLFYLAIDLLPLGTAVALEFTGPIAVAAIGSRTHRSIAALLVAIGGVALLTEVHVTGSAVGVVCALGAGAAWAGYIVLGHRVARTGAAVDGLGVGMVFGAVAIAPAGVGGLGPALDDPRLLLLALATGLLSNAIPYALDQHVLARVARDRFALLLALLPVTAVLIGLGTLGQRPGPAEVAGIGLVVIAIAIRGRS